MCYKIYEKLHIYPNINKKNLNCGLQDSTYSSQYLIFFYEIFITSKRKGHSADQSDSIPKKLLRINFLFFLSIQYCTALNRYFRNLAWPICSLNLYIIYKEMLCVQCTTASHWLQTYNFHFQPGFHIPKLTCPLRLTTLKRRKQFGIRH